MIAPQPNQSIEPAGGSRLCRAVFGAGFGLAQVTSGVAQLLVVAKPKRSENDCCYSRSAASICFNAGVAQW